MATEPRKLFDDGRHSRWLYPGLRIELFPDECKGYFLNLTSGKPAWFVMWRPDEADPLMARPQVVSVSYIECDRWMAAEERVDSLPLPDPLCEWLRLFTNEHFKPDPPRRQRAQSFLSPQERDQSPRWGEQHRTKNQGFPVTLVAAQGAGAPGRRAGGCRAGGGRNDPPRPARAAVQPLAVPCLGLKWPFEPWPPLRRQWSRAVPDGGA
jgi:hypothetical protein